jgi:hypothetical protein
MNGILLPRNAGKRKKIFLHSNPANTNTWYSNFQNILLGHGSTFKRPNRPSAQVRAHYVKDQKVSVPEPPRPRLESEMEGFKTYRFKTYEFETLIFEKFGIKNSNSNIILNDN